MVKLSFISHYYNHPRMVESMISYWEQFPDDFLSQVEFVLVDDCSEESPRLPISTKLNLKVFRIITELNWNQAGARNLATFNATGEWALYFDIDQKFYIDPMMAILRNLDRLQPMNLYYFQIKELVDITNNTKLQFAPCTFLVNLAKFKQHGMYDEDFVGHYGYEDLYMPKVWENNGGNRILFSDTIYFEDMGFGTTNLNRDLSHNLALAQEKLSNGTKNSPGILRFDWQKIDLSLGK